MDSLSKTAMPVLVRTLDGGTKGQLIDSGTLELLEGGRVYSTLVAIALARRANASRGVHDNGNIFWVKSEPNPDDSAQVAVSSDKGEEDPAARQLLSVFTNGLTDEWLGRAESVLRDDNQTANEKLTKIDELMSLPPTVSAEKLGDLVGVSKQAVMKTDWWIQNRKGEKQSEVGRRHDKHQERANQYEPDRQNEE